MTYLPLPTIDAHTPDLAKFARLHISSGDIDPAYPVLRARLQRGAADPTWHLLLYAAFYNLASAEIAVDHHPEPEPLCDKCLRLPTGVERRNLRGGLLAKHVKSLVDFGRQCGGLRSWLGQAKEMPTPEERWQTLRQLAAQPWGNGRWATYKLAELCAEVLGWPLTAPDMGLDGASGPLSGLIHVYGLLWNDPERQGCDLQARLSGDHDLALPLQQLETVLCDFHTAVTGRYYIGADIDLMQTQIVAAQAKHGRTFPALWDARAATLGDYCGERSGWQGFDPDRAKVYRDWRLILDRHEPIPIGATLL